MGIRRKSWNGICIGDQVMFVASMLIYPPLCGLGSEHNAESSRYESSEDGEQGNVSDLALKSLKSISTIA
jgi:hypothetical protein